MGVRAGKYKLGARAGKYKLGARAGKYKFGARAGKYKFGARASKYRFGARAGVGGQAKGRGQRNTNTLTNTLCCFKVRNFQDTIFSYIREAAVKFFHLHNWTFQSETKLFKKTYKI